MNNPTTTSSISLKRAALWYAAHGFKIFPVAPKAKRPLTTNGFEDASIDAQTVNGWWAKWPDANIGLACAPSGLIALDGDPAHYGEGSEAFVAALLKEHPTCAQTTPTLGVHLLYALPEGVRLSNSPGSLPPGVDVRVNGYILLAPSVVTYRGDDAAKKGVPDGHVGEYAWIDDFRPTERPPAPLPEHVLALLKPKVERPRSSFPSTAVNGASNGNGGGPSSYARAALVKELDTLARTLAGERNNQLNRSAFSLGQLVAGGELVESEVAEQLAATALTIGLEPREIERTIRSGLASGMQEPRSVPPRPQLRFSRNGHAEAAEGGEEAGEVTEPEIDTNALLLNTERTDLGNALIAHHLHGKRLAYTSEMGWLYRDDTHWVRDEACAQPTLAAIDTLQRRSQAIVTAFAGREGTEIEKALRPVTPSAKHARDLLFMLRPMVTMKQAEFDAVPYLLNCENGVIDLRSGELVAHDPSDRFTYCVNAEYDPGAWNDGLYLSLMMEWFGGNADRVRYMQRALGYSLTGETREECMFYLVGERGRNGKGTMINGVADIIGKPLTQTVTMRAFTSKTTDPQGFLLAPLHNARMVISSEKSKGTTLDEELVKTITGRDSIQVAFKGKTPFNFTPKFKMWLMSNHPPKGDTSDDAFWSRIRTIIMPNSYQGKEDNTLKDRLNSPEERKATLSWIVLGAMRWYANGLGNAEWVKRDTQRVRAEQDTVLQFADACLEREEGIDTPFSTVYLAYKAWCESEGIQPKANNTLSREMHLRGYETEKKSVRVQGEVNPKKLFYLLNTRVVT